MVIQINNIENYDYDYDDLLGPEEIGVNTPYNPLIEWSSNKALVNNSGDNQSQFIKNLYESTIDNLEQMNIEFSEIDTLLLILELAGVKVKLQLPKEISAKLLITPFTTTISLEEILREESVVAIISIEMLVNSV